MSDAAETNHGEVGASEGVPGAVAAGYGAAASNVAGAADDSAAAAAAAADSAGPTADASTGAGAGAGAAAPARPITALDPSASPSVTSAVPEAAVTSVAPQDALAHVEATCRALMATATHVHVDAGGVAAWVAALEAAGQDTVAACDTAGLPLTFPSVESEVNFWGIMDLLSFGSGYRDELHTTADRGPYETVLFGMVSLHITGKVMDAVWMAKVTVSDIAEYFNFSITKDVKVMTAVYQTVNGPLYPLASSIASVLNEVGVTLVHHGYKDFGAFLLDKRSNTGAVAGAGGVVEEKKDEAGTAAAAPSAARLVHRLATHFAAMCDVQRVDGQDVWLLKKAQQLASDLHLRFRESLPEKFNFVDATAFTALSDSIVPAMLRKLGVLTVTDELADTIDRHALVAPGQAEVELRAASVVAVADVCKALGGSVTPVQVTRYLWSQRKEAAYKDAPRHLTQGIVWY